MSSTIPQYNELSEDRSPANPGFVNKIQSGTPRNESFYLRKLTSYEAYTTSLILGDEGKYTEGPKNRNKDEEIRTNLFDWSNPTGSRWAKVQCSPLEITKTIHELNANDYSFDDKRASLSQVEREHIMDLVFNENRHEHEQQYFEWKLVQFRYEKSSNPKTERNEATSMTIYLARAPKPGVDIVTLYHNLERVYEERETQSHQMKPAYKMKQQQEQMKLAYKIKQQRKQMGGSQHVDKVKQGVLVADKPTAPTSYGNEDRMGSLPPESQYDSSRRNQQNVAMLSNWTLQERLDLSLLVGYHGTDWKGIAASMGTKTHIMVKDYYQRLVDLGRFDLEEIAQCADKCRRKKEAAVPQSPQNMSQEQQSQQPQKLQQQHPSAKYRKPDARYEFTNQEHAMIRDATNRCIVAASDEEKNNIQMKLLNMGPALPPSCQAHRIHPFFSYYRSRVVEGLLLDKRRELANQKPSQGVQTNTPQSTVPMEQQRSRNPNDGKTEEPQQQMLGITDFGFLSRVNPPHQSADFVQEIGQNGIPSSIHQYISDTKVRRPDHNGIELVGEVEPRDPTFYDYAERQQQRQQQRQWQGQRGTPDGKSSSREQIADVRAENNYKSIQVDAQSQLHLLQHQMERIAEIDRVAIEGPFTDSGYASVPKTNISTNDPPMPDKPQCPADDRFNVKMGYKDIDDAKTLYSAATSIDVPHSQQYIAEICSDIFSKLERYFDSTNWKTLETVLPSLIKAFAVKIGHDSSAQVNQDIMYFIHKQHKRIISHLKAMFCRDDDEQPTSPRDSPQGMSLLDKMSMWDSKSGENDTVTENDEFFKGVRDDDDEIINIDLSMYHGIILNSPSYEWLLSSLRKEFFLQWGSRQPRIMVENIRQKILDKLPTGTISKRHPLSACEVTFNLQWGYATEKLNGLFARLITSEILLSELVTITGCQEESQALTVGQYLHQTWPAYGRQLLNVLQKAISHHDHHCFVTLSDNTQLDARIRGSRFIVTTIGPAHFIAECAEKLAWIQAALLSNSRNLAGSYAPSIQNYVVKTVHSRPKKVKHEGYCGVVINFTHTIPQKQRLWQDLVGKSSVIQGFPISRRPEAYPGLELSFALLLSSVQTNEALVDDGIVLLRGPIFTLKLLKDTSEVFLWLPFNPSNGICSCGDYHVEISLNISYSFTDLRRLKAGRHIIGVCRDLLTTIAENSEGTCEKSGLSKVNCAQHHISRGIGPLGNSRNTAYNPNEINPNEISFVSFKSQDDGEDFPPSASSQVDYLVSKNGLPLHTEDQSVQLLLNDQVQLAADSPSNSTVTSQDESLDSDLLSISDASEQFEVPENNASVKAFIDDVVNKLVSGFRNTTQCQFSPGANGNSGESAVQTPATRSSTTSDNLGRFRKKRKAADDGDGDDAGKDKPPPKRACHSPDEGPQRSFACPYLKMDPLKHGKCCAKQLSRIRDVKQHLSRCHTPDRYCQRCLSTKFRDEQALQGHVDLNTCLRNDPTDLEGISNEQRKQLSRKSDSKISEEDQWFAIWEILFLRRARPSSAYMDMGLSRELRRFRVYFDTHAESVMGRQYESTLIWPGLESNIEQRLAFIRTIMDHGATRIFEDYPRSLDSERNRNAVYAEDHGDGTEQAQSEAPLSSTGDSGIAVDSQFSPQGINYRRYTPSQLPTAFDNNAWVPVDGMMQMLQGHEDGDNIGLGGSIGLGDDVGLGDNIINLPNDFFDTNGFGDDDLDFDFLNQP